MLWIGSSSFSLSCSSKSWFMKIYAIYTFLGVALRSDNSFYKSSLILLTYRLSIFNVFWIYLALNWYLWSIHLDYFRLYYVISRFTDWASKYNTFTISLYFVYNLTNLYTITWPQALFKQITRRCSETGVVRTSFVCSFSIFRPLTDCRVISFFRLNNLIISSILSTKTCPKDGLCNKLQVVINDRDMSLCWFF